MEQSPSAPETTSVVEQSITAPHETTSAVETTSVVDESKSEVDVDVKQWKENEPKKETQGQ